MTVTIVFAATFIASVYAQEFLAGPGTPAAAFPKLREHAQFEHGTVSVEAGLMAMLDRMRTGKLKVFKEHLDWWEEFRLYHRKHGKVVKEGDDLLCATRYALMMLRHATTQSFNDKWRREIIYPELGRV